jgi:hypothetical protein
MKWAPVWPLCHTPLLLRVSENLPMFIGENGRNKLDNVVQFSELKTTVQTQIEVPAELCAKIKRKLTN